MQIVRPLSSCFIALALSAAIASAQTGSALHNFQGAPADGQFPTDSLIADAVGNLYGTTQYGGNGACSNNGVAGCGTVFELSPPASGSGKWTEKILYHFQGGNDGPDGSTPAGGLVSDCEGNLYGTTMTGGSNGAETVFELQRPPSSSGAWSEVILYNFLGAPNDLAQPASSLILNSGNLYGSTIRGDGPYTDDCGGVFELKRPAAQGAGWTDAVIHSFNGNQKIGVDGCGTMSGVIHDSSGNLFGTTTFGGRGNNGGTSLGVIYELTPSSGELWSESLPYNFTEGSSVSGSIAGGLIFDSAGNLYGTTQDGGTQTCDIHNGTACGMVFQLTPQDDGSWAETTLYNFESANKSYWPVGSLIVDSAGNLYGVTLNSVYKLAPPSAPGHPWMETVLFHFPGGTSGANPAAGVLAYRRALVGTTSTGGSGACAGTYQGCGTVYRVTLPH